ncbi:erythroblast NAD(P)(+)--arginine ADP-ribosyltransferase-like [Sylvia atricapilla]|uniref:erythroblast NAD(P)(+)--arginine ADP-ribosyltransferase-like n=1 Tax=Sylvia atricapilla TaxID=48155 RepID=UPI003398962D
MAPLVYTLALLAMVVATTAYEVKPLDMAQNSFDDQYQGCGPAMTAALPALNGSEFQKNPFFAQIWPEAVAEWQKQGSRVSPLSSPEQAIALMAFTKGIYGLFNMEVLEAGRSPQEYRDNFHYKTLHFLLTDALATLRDTQEGQCLDVSLQHCGVLYEAQRGDNVRFGQFFITSLTKPPQGEGGCPEETEFQVHTCQGAGVQSFSEHPEFQWVVIPPFETFQVTEITQEGGRRKIQLQSTGTSSKYNCEWLKAHHDSPDLPGPCGLHIPPDTLSPVTSWPPSLL